MSPMHAPIEDIAAHLSGQRKTWRTKIWMAAIAISVIVIGVGGYFYFHRPQLPPLQSERLARGELVAKISATGTIEATKQVDVGAEISGLIKEVLVSFNDQVKQGQVLAVFVTDQMEAEVAQQRANLTDAQANLVQAEASVTEAQAKYQRVSALASGGYASRQDLDSSIAALARAQASVSSAKGKIALAEGALDVSLTQLRKAKVVAPIDGTVLDRIVEPGQTIAAIYQTPKLFILTDDLQNLILKAKVSEADIGVVKVGQSATFSVDAYPDRTFSGVISQIRNAARKVDNVVTYEVILQVSNPALLLKPGMTATADIVTAVDKDVLLLPGAALRFTPPGAVAPPKPAAKDGARQAIAWVMGGDGKPKAEIVTIGHGDGHFYEVLSGSLQAGTDVLTGLKPQDPAS